MLTAVEFVRTEKKIGSIWKFRCDCGNIVELPASRVTTKNSSTKACGCLNKKNHPKSDLTGMKFGKLTVLKYAGSEGRRRTMWWCKCDCGNVIKTDGSHLKCGHTKSCGCVSTERIKYINYKTGLSDTRLYYAYQNMCNRCNRESDNSYEFYGGRGIKVCPEWLGEHGFENFAKWAFENGFEEDAKRGDCTLDRIDANGDYCPENCRWVDIIVQANNKRTTRYIKINGEIGSVANMARKYNVSYWNLLHYSKGGQNFKYPELKIEAVEKGSGF